MSATTPKGWQRNHLGHWERGPWRIVSTPATNHRRAHWYLCKEGQPVPGRFATLLDAKRNADYLETTQPKATIPNGGRT